MDDDIKNLTAFNPVEYPGTQERYQVKKYQ